MSDSSEAARFLSRSGLLAALFAVSAIACTDTGSAKDDTAGAGSAGEGDGGTGGGGGGGAGSGTTEPPDPEVECDDGVDNDEDGLVDCDDDDCAEFTPCTWPESITHEGTFAFAGVGEVICEVGRFDIPVDVPDCVTRYTATLEPVTDPALQCPDCDRTFQSGLVYGENSCESVLENVSFPTEAYFGFIFTSESEWTLKGKDEAGNWEAGVDLVQAGSGFEFVTTTPLNVSPEDCDNSPLYVGDVTVTWTFAEN